MKYNRLLMREWIMIQTVCRGQGRLVYPFHLLLAPKGNLVL